MPRVCNVFCSWKHTVWLPLNRKYRKYPGLTPLEQVFWRLAPVQVIRGGVFVELPDSFWRLRDTSEVRLAKPILLLMGIAHWVASCLFSLGAWMDCSHTPKDVQPYVYNKKQVMGKLHMFPGTVFKCLAVLSNYSALTNHRISVLIRKSQMGKPPKVDIWSTCRPTALKRQRWVSGDRRWMAGSLPMWLPMSRRCTCWQASDQDDGDYIICYWYNHQIGSNRILSSKMGVYIYI